MSSSIVPPLLATPLLLPPHSLILMMEENKEYISVKSLITTLAQQLTSLKQQVNTLLLSLSPPLLLTFSLPFFSPLLVSTYRMFVTRTSIG